MHVMNERERRIRALRDKAVRDLREVIELPEDERAPLLRRVASTLVELRGLHTTKAGDPDWRGQSWEYRTLVSEIYSEAGLERAGESGVKVALRYHIGNALREDLTPEQLEQAGLSIQPPRNRMEWRYKEGANRAEFARALVYRITRTPRAEPDPLTLEQAVKLRDDLDAWIRRHSRPEA